MGPYCKHRVQKENTLLRPFLQIAVIWDITSHIILKLLIDVYQRWRCFHTFFYRKTKSVRLSVIVVRILSKDHHLHLVKGSKMKRIEQIFRRWENLSCLIFRHHGFIKFGIVRLMKLTLKSLLPVSSYRSHILHLSTFYFLTGIPFSAR